MRRRLGLAPRLRQLATVEAATSAEIQHKFAQDCNAFLEYQNLNAFFGGLEGLVGSPSPKVKEMMMEEHTARADSQVEFTTGNYGICTTSSIEFAFVATPDAPPRGTGWPVEEKIRAALAGEERADLAALRASGAQHRQPLPLVDLEESMEVHANGQLRALGEPQMTVNEAIGLRAYTGPLFVKYNAVLRGLNSSVPFLQRHLVEHCVRGRVIEPLTAASRATAAAAAKVPSSISRLAGREGGARRAARRHDHVCAGARVAQPVPDDAARACL